MPRTIILVRHGRPGPMPAEATLRGLADWQARYAGAGIVDAPPAEVRRAAGAVEAIMCSPVRRARESAQKLAGSSPVVEIAEAAEPDLPGMSLPSPSLPIGPALVLVRLAWFAGWHGDAESVSRARARAGRAAELLDRASRDGPVMLVGHGLQNRFIGRALCRTGWRLGHGEGGSSYWSTRTFLGS